MSIDHSLTRCEWCLNSFDDYIRYHDEEWGVPVHDDKVHFEFLVLEGAQAGLSWSTILKRREGYRKAFKNFDPSLVASFSGKDIENLLKDKGIIRNRAKVNSAVNNAGRFLEVIEEFGSFDNYIWRFVDGRPVINQWRRMEEIPPFTGLSDQLSKDLKNRGFSFVGSTIMYAHMQATGLVNDHVVNCFRYQQLGG